MTDSENGTPNVGIDRHRSDEAIYQGFAPGPLALERGEDGLPTVQSPVALPIVPPLSPKTMVCIADRSEYVVRGEWGEIKRRYPPDVVRRAPSGDYYVSLDYVNASYRLDEARRLGEGEAAAEARLGEAAESREQIPVEKRISVEPIRPQCKFLARQMTDFQDASERQMIERLCTARRDSESFFLSVRDQQVHACELRDPPDPVSAERLDRFDEAKMKLGRERYQEGGEFDVDEALKRTESEANRGLAFGGIFKE